MSSDGECSPQKVKLRESRDRSSLSRIRKLKRRISASFMRLSLSREDTIHENDTESDSLRATNGHSSREDSQSPPVFFSLNGTPEHAMYNHGQQADLSNTNGSSSSAGKLDFKGPLGQYKKRSPVKRHHSAGDMLAADISFESVPIRERPSRPKSEGNFYMEGYVPKRASSFGFNSPFGKVDSYQKLEQLGEGSYATVFKGRSNLNSKVVALKEIRLQPEEGAPFTAIREASLLKGLKHSNIVTLHDIIHTKETLTFVFEFVQTDLSQYLEKNTGGLNPHNIKLYLFQLLRGLAYCHCRRILHRDLKPQNLLISEIGELKLADFGLARAKSVPSKTYSHEVVTLWYRPPDVLLGSTDYSTSLDMWGVGCIFTEMISGTATFPGMKDAIDQLERIWRILGTPTEETWEGVTRFPNYGKAKICQYPRQRLCHAIPKLSSIPHAEKLANLFLQMRPEARASAIDSLCHQYFADLPPMIHELPDAASIYNIPGVRLVPERSEVVRPNIRTNIRTNPRAVKV